MNVREKLTVNLPFDAANVAHARAINSLKKRLNFHFGGYTAKPFEGGWMADTGADLNEYGLSIDVSYRPSKRRRYVVLQLFTEAARDCGQTDIHIERTTFEAEHIHLDRE